MGPDSMMEKERSCTQALIQPSPVLIALSFSSQKSELEAELAKKEMHNCSSRKETMEH